MMDSNAKTDRSEPPLRDEVGLRHRLSAGMASLVLSLMLGVPLRSTRTLFPDPDDTTAPYLGL